jgi:hypothetical protein
MRTKIVVDTNTDTGRGPQEERGARVGIDQEVEIEDVVDPDVK